jgi:hypothetical protein
VISGVRPGHTLRRFPALSHAGGWPAATGHAPSPCDGEITRTRFEPVYPHGTVLPAWARLDLDPTWCRGSQRATGAQFQRGVCRRVINSAETYRLETAPRELEAGRLTLARLAEPGIALRLMSAARPGC